REKKTLADPPPHRPPNERAREAREPAFAGEPRDVCSVHDRPSLGSNPSPRQFHLYLLVPESSYWYSHIISPPFISQLPGFPGWRCRSIRSLPLSELSKRFVEIFWSDFTLTVYLRSAHVNQNL